MESKYPYSVVHGYHNLTPEVQEKTLQIAESIFETEEHEDQIQVSEETVRLLDTLTPVWLSCAVLENEPISWVVVVPTQKTIADKFLRKEISERELLEQTTPAQQYDALYLCSAITVPQYRREGIARDVANNLIDQISQADDAILFAWPTTLEGKQVMERFISRTGKTVLLRS